MGLKDIRVVAIGPGSQPDEEDGARLEYIEMPYEMHVYQKPLLPEPESIGHLSEAVGAMEWLQSALNAYKSGGEPLVADISRLDNENRGLVNQILGEGEVSIKYRGAFSASIQEAVLPGVWRAFYMDETGKPERDLLEVGDMPIVARLRSKTDASEKPPFGDLEPPPEVMNAMPILTEIAEKVFAYQPEYPAHVINLTLLPLSPADVTFLDRTLGVGPVHVLSRGYGDCHITSTAFPNLWWVRYYNSTGKLILNTIEVVEVPVVACAAEEDIRDSARRLRDILEPYSDIMGTQ